MSYSADADSGVDRRWELRFTHTATGVKMSCIINNLGGGTEAQKDAVFQGFLDKVATLSGVVIDSAKKYTQYESNVTVT